MFRYKCPRCKGNQYTATSVKEKEPCIYCGNNGTTLMGTLNEDTELQEGGKEDGD